MRNIFAAAACVLILSLFIGLNGASGQKEGAAPTFADVSAIFSKYNCTLCHGSVKASYGLALHKYESLMKGSKNGPVIVPKDPAKSMLVRQIKGEKQPRMPINGPPWVTENEVQVIEKWIAAGAPKE